MTQRLIRPPLLFLAAAMGCAPAVPGPPPPPQHVAIPVYDAAPQPLAQPDTREQPPPSGPTRPFRMPAVTWAELATGLQIGTVAVPGSPAVEVRILVPGGSAADGERTGLAALTAALLSEGGAGGLSGRDVRARLAALGATLSVTAERDAVVFALRVVKERLPAALDLAGLLVQRPRLDAAAFAKLKARAIDAASESAHADGAWGAMVMLLRDLYALPAEQHPYAAFAATPAELARLTAAECRAFHGRWFVPKNTAVVVTGDVAPDAVRAALERAFPDRRGDEPPAISFTDPLPPESLKITIIDRPSSAQSEIFLGFLGPARGTPEWPAIQLVSQLLGGGPASRLYRELRDERWLANAVSSTVLDVASGSAPLMAHVSAPAAKTGLAVEAMLEHVERLAATAPAQDEVEAAARQLTVGLAVRLQGLGAIADEAARLRLFRLADDHHDGYRKELGDLTPAFVGKVAGEYLRPGHASLVLAGDAAVIGPMLSRFGDVKVVDPTHGFERKRTILRGASTPPARRPAEGAGD